MRGQLLGGSHDTAAGVVRHGTARYGTVRGHYGWHRAQQTRTPSQCSEGAHPASHLPLETAPSRARPRCLHPPLPRPVQQIATARAGGPAPLLAGTKARWRMCWGGEIGPGGGLGPACDLHTVQVFTARGVAGPAARGRHPQLCTCHRPGEAGAARRAGALLRGAAPGIPVPPPPACPPALGTGRAPGEASATKRGLPEAAGSSITSA